MGRAYSEELDRMQDTLLWATSVELPAAATIAEQSSSLFLVVIGSGGSFTVATALAAYMSSLRQNFAQGMTPLQYVQCVDHLPPHRVLLVSAEGKNRDILHAARKALSTAMTCDVLTFSHASPLVALAEAEPSPRVFSFDSAFLSIAKKRAELSIPGNDVVSPNQDISPDENVCVQIGVAPDEDVSPNEDVSPDQNVRLNCVAPHEDVSCYLFVPPNQDVSPN